eukprot:173433_1
MHVWNNQTPASAVSVSNPSQSNALLQLLLNQNNNPSIPPPIAFHNPNPCFPHINIYPQQMLSTNVFNTGTLLLGFPPPKQEIAGTIHPPSVHNHMTSPYHVQSINTNHNHNSNSTNSLFNTLFANGNTMTMRIVKPENIKCDVDTHTAHHPMITQHKKEPMPMMIMNHRASHSQIHSNNNEESVKSYSCDVCCKVFKHRSNLKIHYVVHTPDALCCSFCSKKFARKSNLNQHLRVHTGEKPYPCRFCSKKFAQSHSLKDHIRIHTGEKPFQCEFCGKKFKVKHNMIAHRRLHTGEKPFQCAFCVKGFASKSSLNGHQKKKHPFDI